MAETILEMHTGRGAENKMVPESHITKACQDLERRGESNHQRYTELVTKLITLLETGNLWVKCSYLLWLYLILSSTAVCMLYVHTTKHTSYIPSMHKHKCHLFQKFLYKQGLFNSRNTCFEIKFICFTYAQALADPQHDHQPPGCAHPTRRSLPCGGRQGFHQQSHPWQYKNQGGKKVGGTSKSLFLFIYMCLKVIEEWFITVVNDDG